VKTVQYDVAVIGGGPGGYVAAIRAAHYGAKVLLAEKENLGGVCLNKGCIPTKTLLKSSEMYKNVMNSAQFGINVQGISFDFKKMMDRKKQVVQTLVNGINGLMKKNRIDVIKGVGKIVDAGHVAVNGSVYETKNIIIATGSVPFMPNIKGIESDCVLNSDDLLSIEEVPSSIVIIGGGVIGVEFGTLLSDLGCKVTIIEMMEDILFMADSDVIESVRNILKKNHVEIITSAKVVEIADGCTTYEKDGKRFNVNAEKVLVASGRVPLVDADELDRLGIRHNKGRIETDERMRTNIDNIYAIGDVNGKYMLAHVASHEGITAVDNIFGKDVKMSYNAVPQCIYLHPEIAWVGMTEKEAREKGYDIRVGKFPMLANGKSIAEGDSTGFVKIIADKKYNEILGIHMVCSHATDMIAECALAINSELTANEIVSAIHPHPTVSEAVMEAANAVLGMMIHM